MAKDATIYLVGLSTQDGKVRFKKSMEINGLSYEPILIKKDDDGKLKIVASLTEAGDKFWQPSRADLVLVR
jgi:hypothetical protein